MSRIMKTALKSCEWKRRLCGLSRVYNSDGLKESIAKSSLSEAFRCTAGDEVGAFWGTGGFIAALIHMNTMASNNRLRQLALSWNRRTAVWTYEEAVQMCMKSVAEIRLLA